MAVQEGNAAVIDVLSEAIGDKIEARRKASEKVDEVYSSGMRGKEKPPHLRERPKPAKKETETQEGYTREGKRVVTFKAKPRVNQAEQLTALQQQNAELVKRLEKLEGKGAGDGKDKKKVKVKIA
jgi:hypothetical protein